MKAFSLLMIALLFSIPGARAAVWESKNAWAPDTEQAYREFLKTRAKVDLFAREKLADGSPNPYYGIHVDCADLAYSLRAIFSFENGLPFTFVNPAYPRKAPITNDITRFDSVPEGSERFVAFLRWMYDLISTHGVWRDTYSIPFSSVGPGSIILTTRKNHHSWTITDVSATGNPTLLFNSTVGREAGLIVQERKSWPNPYWVFGPEDDPENPDDPTKQIPVYHPGSYAGFRYWRPVGYAQADESMVPGYSDQQFTVGIGRWKNAVQAVLARKRETIDQIVWRLLQDACSDFRQRVDAVQESQTYKSDLASDLAAGKTADESDIVREWMADSTHPSDARCMIAAKFDSLSTPSRDRRLIDGLMSAREYYAFGIRKYGKDGFSSEHLGIYSKLFSHPSLSAKDEAALAGPEVSSSFCVAKIPGVDTLSLARFTHRLFRRNYSSNPNDAWRVRFGFSPGEDDLGASCPNYGLNPPSLDLDAAQAEADEEVNQSSVATGNGP